MKSKTEPKMLIQCFQPIPPTSHHRRPWFHSPSSTLLAIPLQQWSCQLGSLLTNVNKLMSILLAQKSKQHFSCTQRCSSSLCNLLLGQRHAVICSAGFGKVTMSLKPPALLLPATLQLNFFANLLPQVIVSNSGMKSWTVRPCFFITLCFLCTLSAAQNAGGTCCVHMLCAYPVLFSLSLKEASWHAEEEAEGRNLYCLEKKKKKGHLLNELFPFFAPLVQTRVTVISE